ncbi:transcriptional regulator GlxA family with amidase domain [Neisseria sp. HSC-16F19]|nr:helix-turn-helix domain-containing protein [Neisseria sp. HSC-16F19]MCP2040782.1 transcriptional regulator GlxA family with amidase domain [Neisseria sp. HSC-16F19]
MSVPKIALLFHPRIPLFHFSVPHMVFGDLIPGQKLFELYVLHTASLDAAAVTVPTDGGLERLPEMDMLIVAGWHDVTQPPDTAFQAALCAAYARGATLVGLCYGAYALAYCGLLDGKRAATHWLGEQDFSRRFPRVALDSNALYVDEGRIITSAGTAASLDCCLHIVRKYHGSRIANKIARIMVVPPHREGGQAQYIEAPMPIDRKNNDISALLDQIRQNPQQVYRIDNIAAQLAMSRRSFTRHFHKATGTSFSQWLILERLAHSLELLENSSLPIEHIAEQSGFGSAAAFRAHFQQRYGISPKQWRKQFQAA